MEEMAKKTSKVVAAIFIFLSFILFFVFVAVLQFSLLMR